MLPASQYMADPTQESQTRHWCCQHNQIENLKKLSFDVADYLIAIYYTTLLTQFENLKANIDAAKTTKLIIDVAE